MTAVPFDDSARCGGFTSGITGYLRPICITCSRLTLRTTGPLIKGQVYNNRGSADCNDWKPLPFVLRDAGNPYRVAA